jgi:hypothetical protein
MQYKEIDAVPDFKPDIDESLLEKLPENDPTKTILININVNRQYSKWGCETARLAFNLSLQNEKRIDRFQNWAFVTIGALVVAALFKLLFGKFI